MRLEICDALAEELRETLPGVQVERVLSRLTVGGLATEPIVYVRPGCLALGVDQESQEIDLAGDITATVVVSVLAKSNREAAEKLLDMIFLLLARGRLQDACAPFADLLTVEMVSQPMSRDYVCGELLLVYQVSDPEDIPIEVQDASQRAALTAHEGLTIGALVSERATDQIYQYCGGSPADDESWEVQ